MAAKVVATWSGKDDLTKRINDFDRQMKRVVAGQVMYAQNDAVSYARKNAPWTDRTGNARSGLHASVNLGENFAELIVAHSVPYGIWLEVRWSGKYAIIGPTIFWTGKLIISRLESSLMKLAAQS